MHSEPYYMAYEKRYRAVFEAGADRWGHSPDDEVLRKVLADWVDKNGLRGKRIIGFAVEDFVEMEPSSAVQYSASIYVRKK